MRLPDRIESLMNRYKEPSPEQQAEWQKQVEEQAILEEKQRVQRNAQKLFVSSNVPKRHAQTVVSQEPSPWRDKLKAIEAKLGTGITLALVGGRGCGKTQMAVELIRWVTSGFTAAAFFTAMDFFVQIKGTYRPDSETTEADIMERYRRVRLLVIDEIGKRAESDWHNNLLFELLNKRYEDKTDTLLIDNRPKAEFITLVGPSMASRMAETGGIIECNWVSFR